MVERILLDTDIGSDVDDALALLFALKCPDISLEGVTTVYGRTDIRAKVARKICDYAGRPDIAIIAGEGKPLASPMRIWHTGYEGDGILSKAERAAPLEKMNIGVDAPQFLVEKIMSNPGQYTLVTIGALTNVAKALDLEPRIEGAIKQLYIMGGAISYPADIHSHPSVQADPEHNILCDVYAAQRVFQTSTPKTVFPLDVTVNTPIGRLDFDRLTGKGACEKAVKSLVDVWFMYRDELFGRDVEYTCMHDPLTVAAVVYPELVVKEKMSIAVYPNGTTQRNSTAQQMDICYHVHFERFKEIFLETIVR